MKTRIHNEYFMPVVRKSCSCGSNSVRGRDKHQVFAWGEYIRAKWRTVDYFCEMCFHNRVVPRLLAHRATCGCSFKLVARNGYCIPDWITFGLGITGAVKPVFLVYL